MHNHLVSLDGFEVEELVVEEVVLATEPGNEPEPLAVPTQWPVSTHTTNTSLLARLLLDGASLNSSY